MSTDNIDDAISLIEEYDLLSKGAPWGKLYSMDIIRKYGLRFPEDISFHEDHYFVLRYIEYLMCEDFTFVLLKQPYYHYMIRSSFSLTKKKRTVAENVLIGRYMTEAVNRLFARFKFTESYEKKKYILWRLVPLLLQRKMHRIKAILNCCIMKIFMRNIRVRD